MIKFTFVTRNREFGRQMLREMVFPREINEKAKVHDQRYFDILEGYFKTAQERGEISTEPEIFYLSVPIYLGLLAGWYTGYLGSLAEAEEGMRTLFNQAIGGIAK
ncbi:MAG: hypothetical protein L3J57_11885 [Desulfuromusa sp.]|nr:hypothetical protein [Desulfuromusa sp.]